MSDNQDMYLLGAIIDPINHPPITDPVSQAARELAREPFDVVVPTRFVLQLRENEPTFGPAGDSARA